MTTFSEDLKNKAKNSLSPPLTENDVIVQSIRHIARAAMISLGILFAGITSCGIVSELTDEADYTGQGLMLNGKAKVVEAEGKKALAEVELIKAQNTSIVELIQSGTDPIAARCAIIGWTMNNNSVCLALVDKQPPAIIVESADNPIIYENSLETIINKDLLPEPLL